MGRIRTLDRETVDRIAAGEVVERPASVVKELLENSLDAGATTVQVDVVGGGKERVSVRDDGCGMSPEDALKSVERHATSKISSVDDLRSIDTFGFRGEALSSLSSVSRTTIRSREHGLTEGFEIVVEGGTVASSGVTGCPEGTEVSVEDLFYNTPARRKQLRADRAELARCREVVVDFALCRPALSLRLTSNGQPELVHAASEGMEGALALAFGAKVAKDMLVGEAEGDGLRVEAFFARLEHSRPSPSELRLFVNHRPVRSRRMASTVVSGFGSRLMKDRYPVGVVKVFVDASAVDVNVHPTKREVRFDDESTVMDAVARCVADALSGPDLSYRYDLTRFSETFVPDTPVPAADGPGQSAGEQSTLVSSGEPPDERVAGIRPLAQVMDTYILAESEGRLLLIDQHAASERVVYERLLKAIDGDRGISQDLLTPLVLTLTQTEATTLEENLEALSSTGFAAEPFGGGSYALRTVPMVLGAAQGERALKDILADLAESTVPRPMGQEFVWRVACHTSIRAGERLSHQRMAQLVSDLMACESPFTCEHGRPTMVVLSPADMEKLFKRRV